jgi:hypothetical protein
MKDEGIMDNTDFMDEGGKVMIDLLICVLFHL